jgi:hypothetical protein
VHCIGCGVEYEAPSKPRCECAGDPPVDQESTEYQAWLGRVHQLRFDRDTRWAVRLQPSGTVNTVADAKAAHDLAREMAVCDGVTAAEVVHAEPGASGWKLTARYTPDQFSEDGSFIGGLFKPEPEPEWQEPEMTPDGPR